MAQTRSRKLTMLTPAEDKAWVFYFCYFLDEGKGDDEADKLAWREMHREFRRLRGFDGCLPEVRGQRADAKWSALPVVVQREPKIES